MRCPLPAHLRDRGSFGGTHRISFRSLTLGLILMLSGGVTTCFADDAAGRRPVIVISIDTLRADHLSSYGYTKLHPRHTDSFARGGTLFTQSEAQVPLTLPS